MSVVFRFVAFCATVSALSGCSILTESHTCTTEFRFGLVVTVVDSVTGAPPTSALLIARSGTFVDSVGPLTPQPIAVNGPPVLNLLTAGERAGTYDLTVRAPGYRDYTRSGVTVTKGACHVRETDVTARLQR